MLRLSWADVDLTEGYITARSRKQSRQVIETSRQIDIHPELRAELFAWRGKRSKGQFVISAKGNDMPLSRDSANTHFWQPMRGTSWQLPGKPSSFKLGFHVYRHSFASNLAAAGADQRLVDEFMGHQTEAMRKRYRHLFPKQRRSAIECFSLAVAVPEPATPGA
jgi:integrase